MEFVRMVAAAFVTVWDLMLRLETYAIGAMAGVVLFMAVYFVREIRQLGRVVRGEAPARERLDG